MTQDKEQMARQLWLAYFNRTLLEENVITEDVFRRMQTLILASESQANTPCKQAQATF